MSDSRGRLLWFDLMTTDPEAAKAFYTQVVGWGTAQWEGGNPDYTMWKAGDNTIGGVMKLSDDALAMGAPPHWLAYIGSPDADATGARAVALGGQQLHAMTLPGVGRFVILRDPSGAVFSAFTPANDMPGSEGGPKDGECSWAELTANDGGAAFDFYSELFGWEKAGDMDMGPMGKYQMFGRGGAMAMGGMMNKPEQMPVCAWLYYWKVPDIHAAIATAQSNGGTLLNGPHEVPGGDLVAQLLDPQGGAFALHATVAKG